MKITGYTVMHARVVYQDRTVCTVPHLDTRAVLTPLACIVLRGVRPGVSDLPGCLPPPW